MSERESLLGRTGSTVKSQVPSSSSRQEATATTGAGSYPSAAGEQHPLSRWITALQAGYLPSNDQLYAGLHRLAGTLDKFASSSSSDDQSGRPQAEVDGDSTEAIDDNRLDDSDDDDSPRKSTERASHTLFRESAALLRDLSRWITSEDVEVQHPPDSSASKAAATQLLVSPPSADNNSNGTGGKITKVPTGNSREQIQRFVYHASRAKVDVEAELPGKETVKDAASEVAHDASAAVDSLFKLALCVLTSGELQQLATQFFMLARDVVADSAGTVHDVALNVEAQAGAVKDTMKPEESERTSTLALQEIPAKATELAQDTLSNVTKAKEAAQKDMEESMATSMSDRQQKIEEQTQQAVLFLEGIKSDPSYVEALDTVVNLCRKYSSYASQVAQNFSVASSAEGGIKVAADGVDVEANRHLNLALSAAEETLEGLAGGHSLQAIKQQAAKLVHTTMQDDDFQKLFSEVGVLLTAVVQDAQLSFASSGKEALGVSSADSTARLRDGARELLRRAHELFESKPSVKSDARLLIELVRDFRKQVTNNGKNQSIWKKIKKIWRLCKGVVRGGVSAATMDWKHLIADVMGAILPSLLDIVQSVPVPRIEFKSDKVEAVIDDFSIPTMNIVPDSVNVHTAHDFTWRKHAPSSDVTSDVRLTLSGMKLAVQGVSFFVRESYSAPSPTACKGCCGCGTARRCGGGPAEWLAYEESALLDAGFNKDGIDVTIDIGTWETRDNEEELKRNRFFKVKQTGLSVENALLLNLRQSRHWIVNGILLMIARPTIKIVLELMSKSLLQHAFEKADEKVFDLYARARYLSWQSRKKRGSLVKVEPRLWDYVRVFFSKTAGKSQERIAREKREAEDKAKAQAEAEEQTQKIIAEQPKPIKSLEIHPSSIVKHDRLGEYQIAIGLSQPLLPGKSGPPTTRSQNREDLMEGNWKRVAERGAQKTRENVEDADLLESIRDARDTIEDAVATVHGVAHAATSKHQVEVPGSNEQHQVEVPGSNEQDDGWRSSMFDL